jgi:hypothetical protein
MSHDNATSSPQLRARHRRGPRYRAFDQHVSTFLSPKTMRKEIGPTPHDQPSGHSRILPAFCPQITPRGPLLSVMPARKYCAIYGLVFWAPHGMEWRVALSVNIAEDKDIEYALLAQNIWNP